MQAYTEIQSSRSVQSSLRLLLENDKTALSSSSGTAFPTSNLLVGMPCYRTDQNKLYLLKSIIPTPTWVMLLDLSGEMARVSEVAANALVRGTVGNDGGAINLERPESGTTMGGDLQIRLKGDQLQIRDRLTGRGFHLDLSTGETNVATKIWTSANDGAGSGLDADLLDGKQSGNAEGQIPINNGTLNKKLNAEMLNGREEGYFAPKQSPVFTGTPAAPTAVAGANSNQLATTAFVQQALGTVSLNSRVSKTGDTMTGDLSIMSGRLSLYGQGGDDNRATLYLNAAGSRHLAFDGENYTMPGAELYVNGGRVVRQSGTTRILTGFTSAAYERVNTTRAKGGAGWGGYYVEWNESIMGWRRCRTYYTNCNCNCAANCNCDCSNN